MFFEIIVSPFLYFIKWIYALAFNLSGSHGLSIILLSFSVSLVLLPIFILIERAKKRNDAIKQRMKPLADEIKRCYKGQERYYYLKTLNRQHGFNPLKALIPILSLLLQIPFFIAAYQFLKDYEPLTGVKFLFISDLSMPDGLMGSVHLLPILMTLVNMITAYLYTLRGDKSERTQMYVVAGLFLVLLFNLPSGLVLYWTMNNVFSFFRLFITNPEAFRRGDKEQKRFTAIIVSIKERITTLLPSLLRTFWITLVVGIIAQFNWAFHHDFDDIMVRLLLTLGASMGTILFVVILNLMYNIPNIPLNEGLKGIWQLLWPIFRVTFLILATLFVLTQVNWALRHNFDDFPVRVISVILLTGVATALLAAITAIYQGRISVTKFNFLLTPLTQKKGFTIALFSLLTILLGTQVYWAAHHNFNDIVIRFLIILIGVWVLFTLIGILNQKLQTIQGTSLSSMAENYKHKLRKPRTYTLFVILSLLLIATQINWGFQHNFNGFYVRILVSIVVSGLAVAIVLLFSTISVIFKNFISQIQVKPKWFFSLLFAGLYFYIAHKFWYGEKNNTFAVISLLTVIISQGISILYFLKSSHTYGRLFSSSVNIIGALLLISQTIILVSYVSSTPFGISLFGINLLVEERSIGNACGLGIIFCMLFLPFYLRVYALPINPPQKPHYWIVALASIFIAANITFWHPLSVFSTFPETFIFSGAKLLASGIKPFLLIAVSLMALYFPLRKDYRWLLPVFLLWISTIFFIHTYLFPIRVGTLVDDVFTNAQAMRLPYYLYFLEGLLSILLFLLLVRVFKTNHVKQMVITLILINILAAGQSLHKGIRSGSFIQNMTAFKDSPHHISLSKTQPNILFIIPDMMQGWSLNRMLNENPELRKELEGFVWFPNTLAVSTVTNTSLGPLLGGLNYVPDKLDGDKSRTISEKLGDIKMDVIRQAKEKEMDFTSNRLVYINLPDSCYDNFLPEWHSDWDAYLPKIGIEGTIDKNLDLLKYNALFYNVPLALKPAVYNNGQWLFDNFSKKRDNEAENLKHQFLRLLPYLTNTNEENGSFILYYSFVTHMPWITINNDGTANRDITPYDNYLWTTQQLVKWFNWMKENGVYDNTRIIIASDHGADWNQYKGDFDIDIPFRNYEGQSVTLKNMFFLNSMLLVKDFNAHGLLTEDWRFMSMADAMGLAFSDTIAAALPSDSLRILPAFLSWWADGIGQRNSFLLEHKYMVKESIFDGENWTMVWDKNKGVLKE